MSFPGLTEAACVVAQDSKPSPFLMCLGCGHIQRRGEKGAHALQARLADLRRATAGSMGFVARVGGRKWFDCSTVVVCPVVLRAVSHSLSALTLHTADAYWRVEAAVMPRLIHQGYA